MTDEPQRRRSSAAIVAGDASRRLARDVTPLRDRDGRLRADGRNAGWADADQAWGMVSSMAAGPLAWGGIGWLLDRWLDTGPWLLAAGVVVGFVLGFYLTVKRSDAAHTPRPRTRGAATAAPGAVDDSAAPNAPTSPDDVPPPAAGPTAAAR